MLEEFHKVNFEVNTRKKILVLPSLTQLKFSYFLVYCTFYSYISAFAFYKNSLPKPVQHGRQQRGSGQGMRTPRCSSMPRCRAVANVVSCFGVVRFTQKLSRSIRAATRTDRGATLTAGL